MSDLGPTPLDAVERAGDFPPACPVDRLPARRRNRICLWIIMIGMLNFLLYTLTYAAIGGDAHNGHARLVTGEDGVAYPEYVVRGHFLRSIDGRQAEVGRYVWIYSYLHSISLPLTSGAMIISMLVLARPHILATMRDSWVNGQTFIVAFCTIVILIAASVATVFSWDFLSQLASL